MLDNVNVKTKRSLSMKKEIKAENVLFQVLYTLIVVVSVLSMAFAGIVSAENEAIEATVLPLTVESQPEEPSSILTITILNETTASGEWLINAPGEFASYIPYEKKRLEENINSLEKGVEDLLLQEVKNIKIIEGDETIILTFDLRGNYTNSFVTGKFRYTYELNEYAPCFLNVLKIVIPPNKTLVSVNPGVNAREGNALIYYNYNWIYPIDIRFSEKALSILSVSVTMGKEWETPKPYLVDSSELSEEKSLRSSELSNEYKSCFAEEGLWVGTGEDNFPDTLFSADQIAHLYEPLLYLDLLWADKCPDAVYYRVIKGKDYSYPGGFDAYLIQYVVYWGDQNCFPFSHKYDYEPIFIWVKNIEEKPYRVAYDHMGQIYDNHVHQIHRTYNCIYPLDGHYENPSGTHTNDKAYYPYGKTPYKTPGWNDLYLLDLSTSLNNNWYKNHVKLGIANCYHTFDTDISGFPCGYYLLLPLTDEYLIAAYLLKGGEAFKYDISDPFKGVFWEDHYHHEDLEFPTISGNIKSAVVNNEILTVEVSMSYDNTGAGGSSGKHLRGLWKDRFDAANIEDPYRFYHFNEQSEGEYILKFDVSGIDLNSVLSLSVRDNVGDFGDACDSCLLSADITFVPAEVNIIAPTKTSPASAGDYENPSQKVDVTVDVKGGTTPVTGLNNADFTFNIGGKTATASLIDSSIPGTYVFDLTPPTQDVAGKYGLEVSVQYIGSALEDTEEAAVIYTTAEHADVMLIIDRSGSMRWSSPAIENAKESAKLFVDYMRDDDRAGVVSFASSASYNYHLTPLTAAIKIAIKNAIDSIYASGSTAMGEGLRYGLNDLTSLGDTTHSWAMVLLSDGYHNAGEDPNNVLPDIKALDIRVFTIGLGDYVDRALLEHIATETGGEYYHAATSDQLREIYNYIVGKVVGWQTVLKRKAIIFLNQIQQIFVPIEDAFEAIFSISWGGSDLDLVLYKPDGTKIDPAVAATDPNIEYVKEVTYTFYRVTDPDPGQWTMEVTGVDVPPEGEEFTATVKAISTLNLYLSTDKDQYNQDEVIKTIVSITEGGLPITGATVNADITMPDGSTESLSLYDDGGHGDTAANDGVYANYFTNTGQIGDYKIDVSATGTTPSRTSFSRQAETTVEVVAGQSSIQLIPDTWNETVNASEKIEKTFNVSDPPTVGEKLIINKDLYAEYNGTHYLVYEESSIGGEPDYILSALPTTEKSLAASNVSKWVLLTPTSLETPTGDLIDASNIIITPSTVQVPLNGSEKFNVGINIPSDAISGVYSGKIVASAIGSSDSIDLKITVIGIEGTVIKLKKTSSPNPVAPGGTVTYTINYTNSGGVDLTNLSITENYPKGMTFISADPAPDAGTNNKWTIGTLSAGSSGQIIIKLKVPESRDLAFTESGSVTGEGFVMVSKDLSTEQKPYSLKNVVTLSCAEQSSVSASAFTTVSGVPGTSLELTEHGSGIYSSDEILNLQTKNKSIMLQKSTEAEYQPTSFLFSDGFAVNFATRWMQDICARNIIMGDAMHKKIKEVSYIKDETIAEVGGYRNQWNLNLLSTVQHT